jgi:hypothetical protein
VNPAVNEKLEALRRRLVETTEDEWKTKIIAALKKGYEQDGLDGLKMAAFKLEGQGASKQMLASVLSVASREKELDGLKLKSDSKFGFALLVMYADDLKRGR